jgi:hypothetical protein
LSNP